MFGVVKFPVCFPGSGNGPKCVLFDLGTESKIELCVCACERKKEKEIINLSVLSVLYYTEPTGTVLFFPLYSLHTLGEPSVTTHKDSSSFRPAIKFLTDLLSHLSDP